MIPLIVGIIITVLCFILILFNWGKKNFSPYLFAYYFCTGILSVTIYHNFSNPSINGFYVFYLHFAPLFLLNGVFFFFYVKSKIDNKNILDNPWNYLHFFPSLIQFLSIFNYYFIEKIDKLTYIQILLENPNKIFSLSIPGVYFNQIEAFLARPIALFIYSLMSIFWLIKKKSLSEIVFNPNEYSAKRKDYQFIWSLAIINCLLAMAMFSSFIYNYTFPENLQSTTFTIIKTIFIITVLMQILSLLFSPNILYGFSPIEKKKAKLSKAYDLVEEHVPDELIKNGELFLKFIENKKPYLNHNFSKSDLLIELQLSPKELNDIFEQIIKKSFPAYKNTLRVEHAKNMLKNGEANKLTMDGIGLNAGFASRSSFYAIFKAETGYTPVEFVEKLRM